MRQCKGDPSQQTGSTEPAPTILVPGATRVIQDGHTQRLPPFLPVTRRRLVRLPHYLASSALRPVTCCPTLLHPTIAAAHTDTPPHSTTLLTEVPIDPISLLACCDSCIAFRGP
jgi:hypothetical protein